MSDRTTRALLDDEGSATQVLAFVLCPASAFAPDAEAEEVAEVAALMLPLKTEAIRRFAIELERRRRS